MTKVVCDRCGQECVEGSTFYTIDIYGHDTQQTNDGRIAFDAYTQNFNTNLQKILKQERHYCKKCKDEIEAFMNSSKSIRSGNRPIIPFEDSTLDNEGGKSSLL